MSRIPAGVLPISDQYQRNITTAVYNRLIALNNYDENSYPPLRSPIILLKPTMQTMKNISNDYGLSALTREKLDIHTIDGNHVTILDDDKVATAINGEPLEDADAFKARIMEDGKILAPIANPSYNRS